jgi:hypothetical protein
VTFTVLNEHARENIQDRRIYGYYVYRDGWSIPGSWLQHDRSWGPLRTARMYFFYKVAEEDTASTTVIKAFVSKINDFWNK